MTNVLLADDDDVGRYVIATMLRRAGFSVREVADGLAALEAAERELPDIAILDVKMPGLDGFEACRRLKSNELTRHIPVLMLSATFLETDAHVEGLETGADGYLTQPVEAPVLAATVRALVRARSAEDEVRRAASEWRTTFEAISDAVAVLDGDGLVVRANRAFTAIFGEAAGARVPALDAARTDGELELGDRLFSARFDAVSGSASEVVTLGDVTAARQTLAAERSISRTLQLTLLPPRLPPTRA
jgi:CheY-like chemotaxis protein